MKEAITRLYRHLSNHPRWVTAIVFMVFVVHAAVSNFWPIYTAVPALPASTLQLVGLEGDGARYVAADGRAQDDGKLRAIVLVVFDPLFKVPEVTARFETEKEWIDCARQLIELEGVGFYDDQGQLKLTRYFERKPQPVGASIAEVDYLCHNQQFQVPPVTGYQATLDQERAVRSQAAGK